MVNTEEKRKKQQQNDVEHFLLPSIMNKFGNEN